MVIYALIMFLCAGLILPLGIQIFRGNISLIQVYHRARVKKPLAYAKAFGAAMLALSAVLALSGAAALLKLTWPAVLIAVAGTAGCIAALYFIQKKYNGGVF